jgi:hypothetical protein
MSELKQLQAEIEKNFFFLTKKQLSYIKACIKLAHQTGRAEVARENYEGFRKN